MRIIDADRLTELIEKIVPQSALELGYLYQIREYIKQMPTVDREDAVLKALEDVKAEIEAKKEKEVVCIEEDLINGAFDDALDIIDRKIEEIKHDNS